MKLFNCSVFVAVLMLTHSTQLLAVGEKVDLDRYSDLHAYFLVAGKLYVCDANAFARCLDDSCMLLDKIIGKETPFDGTSPEKAIVLEGISKETFSYLNALIHFGDVRFPTNSAVENTRTAALHFGFTGLVKVIETHLKQPTPAWMCSARCDHSTAPKIGLGMSRSEAWDNLCKECRVEETSAMTHWDRGPKDMIATAINSCGPNI
jgi:hypothetical protein